MEVGKAGASKLCDVRKYSKRGEGKEKRGKKRE